MSVSQAEGLLGIHIPPPERIASVLLGGTRSGKTTFLRTLLRPEDLQDAAMLEVGDESGESVTVAVTAFNTSIGLVFDGPGSEDTRLILTNKQIGQLYFIEAVESGCTKLKFLLFDSHGNESVQLRRTLAFLEEVFGPEARRAAIVVASKGDWGSSTEREQRLELLKSVMDKESVRELVSWQSCGLDAEAFHHQLQDLQTALTITAPVESSAVSDLGTRVQSRAQQLCDQALPRTKRVEREEEFAVEYSSEEEYAAQEPYQHTEKYDGQEAYEYSERYESTDTVTVMRAENRQVWHEPQGPFLLRITFSGCGDGASEEDIRTGSKGDYIYPRFEFTHNASEAIRSFGFVMGDAPPPPGFEKIHFDLNKGARGTYNWLCVSYGQGGPPVSAVTFLKFSGSYSSGQCGEWLVYPQDLLVNGRGRYVYVGYKLAQGFWGTTVEQVPTPTQVTVTRYRDVTRFRPATLTRQETRYNTVMKKRPARRFRTATRTVTWEEELPPLPEDFRLQALEEIRETIRAGLQNYGASEVLDVSPEDSVSAVDIPEGVRIAAVGAVSVVSASEISLKSWISVGQGARCFLREATFYVAPKLGNTGGYLRADQLSPGCEVRAADGLSFLRVVRVVSHTSTEIIELRAGGASLRVTPTHRAFVPPIPGSSKRRIVLASELQEGDEVVCSSGTTQSLTHVRRVRSEESGVDHFQVVAISFQPDHPVAVFEPSILSFGSGAIRRGGMSRRIHGNGSGGTTAAVDLLSIPDTAAGEYAD